MSNKKTWEKRIWSAKEKHRPKLSKAQLDGKGGWEKDRFAFKTEGGTIGRYLDFESLKTLDESAKGH